MNKPLKFSRDRKKWFYSDLHLGHEPSWGDKPPLWKSRGFPSLAAHDKWVKEQHYALIGPEDDVFNIGDVTFQDPKGARFRDYSYWPGRKHLINGNHWSGQRQIYLEELASRGYQAAVVPMQPSQMVYPLVSQTLIFMGDMVEAYIEGIPVFMQHRAPYIWPEIGDGGYAICGHSHGRCPELNPDNVTQGRILDVGVDNAIAYNGTPFFSWDDIKRIMDKKPIVPRDHH